MNKEQIYKNLIIDTLENKINFAEHRQINEMTVTLDVLKDILSFLKEPGEFIGMCLGCKVYKSDTQLVFTCYDKDREQKLRAIIDKLIPPLIERYL